MNFERYKAIQNFALCWDLISSTLQIVLGAAPFSFLPIHYCGDMTKWWRAPEIQEDQVLIALKAMG